MASKEMERGDAIHPGAVHDPAAALDAGVEEAYTADIKETIQNVDHDDAADLFAGSEDSFHYTDKEAVCVRWKLDLILLSMVRLVQKLLIEEGSDNNIYMTLTYIFSFIDKAALSEASIFDIRTDDVSPFL
jgi:ACS family allantoate permease-like MFS transporter